MRPFRGAGTVPRRTQSLCRALAPGPTVHAKAGLWLAGLLMVSGLAGCTGGGSDSGTPPATSNATAPPQPHFDGDAALAYVRGLALGADGQPRYRIPGTPGQAEGAAYLWATMQVPGWTAAWQNLTGRDYLALDRRVLGGYGPDSQYCTKTARDAMANDTFHNLYAVHAGAKAGGPLFLIGAHWDSQRHSDEDPNSTRRLWPDPGANDGASGVGLLLQLMRELQGSSLPFDVGVVMLDGEDGFFDCYPLAGSLYFAQHPPVTIGRFLLLDMVGDKDARYIREGASAASDPKGLGLLWHHGRAMGGEKSFTETSAPVSDDHLAFIQAKVPSVDLIDAGWEQGFGFPPQWDTTFDTVDRVSPAMLGLVGRTIRATIEDPAFAAEWPASG